MPETITGAPFRSRPLEQVADDAGLEHRDTATHERQDRREERDGPSVLQRVPVSVRTRGTRAL